VLTVGFPFLFHETWPVVVLAGASAAIVAAVKFVPALRQRLGGVANRVERTTLGEIYFPVAVAFLFWLSRGEHPLLFVVPVLMLTFADATCALVGGRYGITPYVGTSKSLEGSIAFVVVAFLCVHVPLLLWSTVGRIESLLIATTLALLVMLLEGSAWRGLDNLFIPIGGYFLLHAYVPMDAGALASRLAVTLALVVLVLLVRHKTTLEDDSLVAGAFLCYVAWALMGWTWLIGPIVAAAGYRLVSPATNDNSRRMHGMPVLLSVWAAAVVWLAVGRQTRDQGFLVPYTVVFATHMAIFGVSRLAHQFAARRLPGLIFRSVVMAWALVMVPVASVIPANGTRLAVMVASLVLIALGTAVFVATESQIRATPQNADRWLRQAVTAAGVSGLLWAALPVIVRVLG
jgi:phytol kinase